MFRFGFQSTLLRQIVLGTILAMLATAALAKGGGRGDGARWRELGDQFTLAVQEGDMDRAERIARERLDLAEAGPPRRQGNAWRNLARVMEMRGRYRDAEIMLKKALPLIEQDKGPGSHQAIRALFNLNALLRNQARYAEAETVARDALQRQIQAAPGDPDVLSAYTLYAKTLRSLGRREDALEMLHRAEKAEISTMSRDGRNADYRIGKQKAQIQYTLGLISFNSQDYEDAARRARAAVVLFQGVSRDNRIELLPFLSLEGEALGQLGQLDRAEDALRQTRDLGLRFLGKEHRQTAQASQELARVLALKGKDAEAESLYREAIQTVKTAGVGELQLRYQREFARFLAERQRPEEALPFYREALDGVDAAFARTRGLDDASREGYIARFTPYYREALQLLLRLDLAHPGQGHDREALSVVSRTQSRIFTELLRRSDVSRASDDPRFKSLKKRQTDLQAALDDLRRAQVRASRIGETEAAENGDDGDDSVPGAPAPARTGHQPNPLLPVEKELAAVEQLLWQEYPRYMELTQPRPVTVELLQKSLLRPEETLITYALHPDRVLIFLVTAREFRLIQSAVKREEVSDWIAAVRKPEEDAGAALSRLAALDPETLNRLYRVLFEPVRPFVKPGKPLLMIADGPLYTLPMEMLVERYEEADRAAFAAARQAGGPLLGEYAPLNWLGKQFRFNYLPSLSAFASIRLYRRPATAFDQNLVSFADPVFEKGAYSDNTRNGLSLLARSVRAGGELSIPRLPETADEAREIAAILGGRSEIFLRETAQEHKAKTLDLRHTRFVHFATHGLLGGEFAAVQQALGTSEQPGPADRRRNLAIQAAAPAGIEPDDPDEAPSSPRQPRGQPALVLSLSGDLRGEDGLLTMGEVIESLNLDAQLVVLSACNTAGEGRDALNGEGFAGLTRAFMYAGARGLLVSHWSVESQSTRELMAGAFRGLAKGAGSQSALADAQEHIRVGEFSSGGRRISRAHPYFWAPFVYVGD